jgi:opacity protein-like surface antigen
MKRLLVCIALIGLVLCPASWADVESTLEVDGFVAVRGGWVEGPPAWIEGGFGRLYAGADEPGDNDFWGRGEAQVALTWSPTVSWRARVHALARLEDSDAIGRSFGLTEAWLGYQRAISNVSEISARGGLFFYPSSQENIDPLWGSPYTLTYSAINSWFGEEFRPLGLDVEWRRFIGQGDELGIGATVFGGNDTMGTLLAWRGWAMHDRLSVYNERLPLPPVFSLEAGRYFGEAQRNFRTTAFGSDLDDRLGYALRARFERPGQWSGQVAWVDNRGDRELHGREYAWHTRFWIAGTHWQINESFELMAEWNHGTTTMNFPGMPWVNTDFRAAYLMGSWMSDFGRWSLRHDRFVVDDLIGNVMWGLFDDRGHAWTLAWMFQTGERSRLGAEVLWLNSNRIVAGQSGFPTDTDGTQVSVEWRWLF